MDKVRVYELAQDIGITSPETIRLLKDKLQIRVKSASSTIEEDVAIKLKRLIRLEGKGTISSREAKEEEESPAVVSGEEQAQTASRRRAERARKAILAEMEEEERAEARRKAAEERAAKRRAEEERLAAERAAREEAARLAAVLEEQEALQTEVDAQARAEAILDGREPGAALERDEAVGPGEVAPATVTTEEPSEKREEATRPVPAPSPAEQYPGEGTRGVAQASLASHAERAERRPSQRSAFVPGPTSTVIRPRIPGTSRSAGAMKPIPPPPRPAAPIKTVTRRRPDAKPRVKGAARKGRPTAAEIQEQAIPEPKLVEPPKPVVPKVFRKITLTEGVTVKELAEKMEVKHKDLIKALMGRGVLATINQTLSAELAVEVAREFGCEAEILSFEEDVVREEAVEEKPEDIESRAPVVTVMGHVDHGKTSLLDAIRETKVVEGEAGGITQHIGAYKVETNGRSIVFLDTPGHEAFTMMRARGARVTDLVILVVAADDGVMPQTIEAIDHAKVAGVPLMVAVNKIDKPGANSERVKKQLADIGLVPEDWGGSTVFCEVSAKKRLGLDLLLEMVLLVADLQELKANPKRAAMGTVLEAKIDKGKGPVAHVLIQNGTARVGDSFIAGAVHGKIRAMLDDRGHKVKKAEPATPVEILGLTSLPQAGDQFQVVDSSKARQIGEFRQQKLKERQMALSSRLTLDHLHQQVQEGMVKELPIVLKADVQGSVEVLSDTLSKLSSDKVKVKIIRAGAGAVTDADVALASVSNAVIVGFNVRPQRTAAELAEKENIDIRLHTVIYNVTDEIKKALVGLLEPTFRETTLGRAEIRDTFRVPKIGTVAGCYVTDGKVLRSANARLLRDNVIIHEGKVGSLRRFKEDVPEVKQGFECGIGLAGYNDVKKGDVIEVFAVEKVQDASIS
ncbi:MAG TPA: translation initiation factor IF-2 [Vicinamibacteria bacterium]|jgi:translation initiation factor IF-2